MKMRHVIAASAVALAALSASAAQASTNLVYSPSASVLYTSSAINVDPSLVAIMTQDLVLENKIGWYPGPETRYIFGSDDLNGTIIIDLGAVHAISSIGTYIDLVTQDRPVNPGPVAFATSTDDITFTPYGLPTASDLLTTNPVVQSGLVSARYIEYTYGPTDNYYGGFGGSGVASVFATAVPEPATWAMLLLGFGAIGWTLRGARRSDAIQAA